MRIRILLFLLLAICFEVKAQSLVRSTSSLISPYQSMLTHLSNLEEGNFHPEIAAKVFNPKSVDEEKAMDLAIQLLQIYKGAGIVISFARIPNIPDYKEDSLSGNNIYIVNANFPNIYLEKDGDNWYYSNETVESISSIHKELYPFGVDKLLVLLPKLGTTKYVGFHLWQLIGILFIILISLIIHKIFTLIIEKIIIRFLIKRGYKSVARRYVAPVARPMSILILFPILLFLIPVLQLSITINNYILLSLKALWPVFAIVVCYRIVDVLGMYMMKLAERTDSTLDDQLVPLVRKALKLFVIIVGALAILANLDIDILPLLTGLSIGGLAFALAAQDTLKNFFGSIMIFIDKPFQIGDWITSGNIDGTVEEVGFRATRVRTFRDSVTYVPNSLIADKTVDNHGLRNYRRFYTQIAINYDTPANVINVFIDGLRKIVDHHPQTRKDNYHVYLNDMADSSLNVMFYIFFEVPTWGDELRCRHEVLIEIIKLAEELGVNFAFPTSTLHMETFPEKKSNSPIYQKNPTMLKKQLQAFLDKPKDWDEKEQGNEPVDK